MITQRTSQKLVRGSWQQSVVFVVPFARFSEDNVLAGMWT
jgi:hypothetical protein